MLIKKFFRHWTYQVFAPGTVLREKYEAFKRLLEHDRAAHEHLESLGDDEKALEYYLIADRNMVNPIDSKLKIARLYFKKAKMLQADDFITQVLRMEPENEEALALRRAI